MVGGGAAARAQTCIQQPFLLSPALPGPCSAHGPALWVRPPRIVCAGLCEAKSGQASTLKSRRAGRSAAAASKVRGPARLPGLSQRTATWASCCQHCQLWACDGSCEQSGEGVRCTPAHARQQPPADGGSSSDPCPTALLAAAGTLRVPSVSADDLDDEELALEAALTGGSTAEGAAALADARRLGAGILAQLQTLFGELKEK